MAEIADACLKVQYSFELTISYWGNVRFESSFYSLEGSIWGLQTSLETGSWTIQVEKVLHEENGHLPHLNVANNVY